ncbi:hypothetical protein C8F01DRAFT_1174908, partial [Mycena amicta]
MAGSGSGWYGDTFVPGPARSRVESALAGSIGDVIQEISDKLPPSVFARLTFANNAFERVEILFSHLDSQSENAELVLAFQKAVSEQGCVGYLLLPEEKLGAQARSRQARADASRRVRDSRESEENNIAEATGISAQNAHLILEESLGESLDEVQKKTDIKQIPLCDFISESEWRRKWEGRLMDAEAANTRKGRLNWLPDIFHHRLDLTVDVIIREKNPWETKDDLVCHAIKCRANQDLHSVLWMVDIWAKSNGSGRVSSRNPFFYPQAMLDRQSLQSVFAENPDAEIRPHKLEDRIADLKSHTARIELVLYLDRRSVIQLESSSGAIFGNIFSFGETKKYVLKGIVVQSISCLPLKGVIDSREGILRRADNVIKNDHVRGVLVAGERKTRNYRWTELLQAWEEMDP